MTSDFTHLVTSLFALIPIPVAIVDRDDRVVIANSYFNELFPEATSLRGVTLHEVIVPGRGMFDIEFLPLNDQGFKIVHGVDVSKEVHLRRQLAQLESRVGNVQTDAEQSFCHLNDVVRSVARTREPFTRVAKINVSMDLGVQLPAVRGSSRDLEKVLSGLLTNAEQAIYSAQLRCSAIRIRTWVDRGFVRLSISDNGCGVNTREAFSTDCKSPRLIEIGLCAEIIKNYGGELFGWSSYESGSTYTLELPMADVQFETTPVASQNQRLDY